MDGSVRFRVGRSPEAKADGGGDLIGQGVQVWSDLIDRQVRADRRVPAGDVHADAYGTDLTVIGRYSPRWA